jgi:UDP-N-acetylmuramoyl-tripeptide--D-alanyl-D-alanine ligase
MSAPLWTSSDIAAALGLGAGAEWIATGVSIDSRTLQAGDLFVALAGPRHDGHEYLAAAFSAGAAAAIVARAPACLPNDGRLLAVPDTLEALRRLGVSARARTSAKVLAVTGSVGKTGVKEALKLALAAHGATHGSTGSYNNHIGVPITLARLPAEAAFAVIEIGMNHAGEISPLAQLVRAHVALITTIGPVHLEHFPDNGLDGIAEAKAEIFDGTGGETAVINRDNAYFDFLATRARERGFVHVVGFGAHEQADARLVEVTLEPTSSVVTASIAGAPVTYRVGIPGRHWAINSLAVLAAAVMAGADLDTAAAQLARLTPAKGRGQRHRVTRGAGVFELIDDSYNASPVSMRAAFSVLGAAVPGPVGRRIVVLGDMLELGPDAAAMHADLAGALVAARVDVVFTCGRHMAELDTGLPGNMRGAHAVDAATLAPLVKSSIRPGDVVLVKGSLGSRMAIVVEALLGVNGSDVGGRATRAAAAPRAVNF